MVPLKQLVQHDPIKQSAKPKAEQQGRQEREPYRASGNPFRFASMTTDLSGPIIDARRLDNHLPPPRAPLMPRRHRRLPFEPICRLRILPMPATN
jgi:hypothetical protein